MERIFLAHRKELEDEAVDAMKRDVVAKLEAANYAAEVTTARDDYLARARYLGSFERWIHSVATDTAPDGEPLFHTFVVPDIVIGRATAGILATALNHGGRSVFYWSGVGAFQRVSGIVEQASHDFKNGWMVVLGRAS